MWWHERRWRYNRALVLAFVAAGISYLTIAWACENRLNNLEITLFTIGFDAIGVILAIALANLLYLLGPGVESMIQPQDPARLRRVLFGLGLWFSILLPFAIPVDLLYTCLF